MISKKIFLITLLTEGRWDRATDIRSRDRMFVITLGRVRIFLSTLPTFGVNDVFDGKGRVELVGGLSGGHFYQKFVSWSLFLWLGNLLMRTVCYDLSMMFVFLRLWFNKGATARRRAQAPPLCFRGANFCVDQLWSRRHRSDEEATANNKRNG